MIYFSEVKRPAFENIVLLGFSFSDILIINQLYLIIELVVESF